MKIELHAAGAIKNIKKRARYLKKQHDEIKAEALRKELKKHSEWKLREKVKQEKRDAYKKYRKRLLMWG